MSVAPRIARGISPVEGMDRGMFWKLAVAPDQLMVPTLPVAMAWYPAFPISSTV